MRREHRQYLMAQAGRERKARVAARLQHRQAREVAKAHDHAIDEEMRRLVGEMLAKADVLTDEEAVALRRRLLELADEWAADKE